MTPTLTRLGCTALLQAATLAALVPGAARATVILAGKTKEEDVARERASREAGKKHRFMVGVAVGTDGDTRGSAVFLGFSKDGQTGFVLTVAHGFIKGEAPTQKERTQPVTLYFGPSISRSEDVLEVPGLRVIVHPGYATRSDTKGKGDRPIVGDDVALVFFDASRVKAALDRLGVKAAALYDGQGFKRPLLEAEIVGYGLFGTNESPWLDECGRKVHAGRTLVSFGKFQGRTVFQTWCPYTRDGYKAAVGTGEFMTNRYQFALAPRLIEIVNPYDKTVIRIQTHEDHAVGTPGDSGGPLVLNTSRGLMVAGLYSISYKGIRILDGLGGDERYLLGLYEPVMGHRAWIQAVQEGQLGKSIVLCEADQGAAKAQDDKGATCMPRPQ
jgi:hypothetical protein